MRIKSNDYFIERSVLGISRPGIQSYCLLGCVNEQEKGLGLAASTSGEKCLGWAIANGSDFRFGVHGVQPRGMTAE